MHVCQVQTANTRLSAKHIDASEPFRLHLPGRKTGMARIYADSRRISHRDADIGWVQQPSFLSV